MTDDLRARIAAAIMQACHGVYMDDAVNAADAVAAQLTNPIRGCTDLWHWSSGEPYQCPSCSYRMGEGYA